jgi:hypothetical protein
MTREVGIGFDEKKEREGRAAQWVIEFGTECEIDPLTIAWFLAQVGPHFLHISAGEDKKCGCMFEGEPA